MDYRDLRYFSCVAELRSFTQAATILRTAQPALSRCLKQLEEELGVQLLNRHGRGVTLTEAGEVLYKHAQQLLRGMRQAETEVMACAGKPAGHLTLAMPPAAGQVLGPPLVERYRALYPAVSLHLLEGFSGYIHEWLTSGRVDVAILHNPTPSRLIHIQHLLVEQMFVIVAGPRAPMPSVGPESYTVADLAELSLILPSRPHSLRILVEQAAAEAGFPLRLALEVDGLPLIKAMVERGLGATVLTYAGATNEIASGLLRAVPIHDPGIHWRLDIASRFDRQKSSALQELIRLIGEEVQTLVAREIWQGSPELACP